MSMEEKKDIRVIRRKLDEGRRMTIPKSFLEQHGISGATEMEIECTNNSFIIRQAKKRCILCASDENIIDGFLICKACAEDIGESLQNSKASE